MWTKTRVDAPGKHACPRAKPCRPCARSPIGTPGTRATRGNGENSATIPWRGIRVFSAISTYTDERHSPSTSTWALSNEPLLVLVCTYAPRRTPYTRMLSRVEAWTVYKYNETCEPHNITSLLSLARDID